MKTSNIPVRISESERTKLADIAKRRGVTLTEFMRHSITVVGGFDDEFSERLENFCLRMNLPESMVIQNIITSWMARQDAEREVYPQESKTLLEFAFSPSGPLPSRVLYENLKHFFIDDFERERARIIQSRKDQGKASKEEIDWLEKRENQRKQMEREREQAGKDLEEGRIGFAWGPDLQKLIDTANKSSSEEEHN